MLADVFAPVSTVTVAVFDTLNGNWKVTSVALSFLLMT